MKITHTESGKPYHLKPGTQLEIERTNLFFNEWGEQSNPIDLPDTDHNRQLLGYPDLLANQKKPSVQIPVTIEHDEYFMACRQAILGAQRKNSISTSFYMNEGSFLARISKVQLSDVFSDEVIPGVTTVEQGINFCRSLIAGNNPNFAIFPVLISGEDDSNGKHNYKHINRYGYSDSSGRFYGSSIGNYERDFYNAVSRTETVNEETIQLSPGYYISPFVRVNYVLKRIFQYFGYTLVDNFFTQTHPFPDMVFVNTCADALINGTIRLVDLLPDCMCSTILNLFRKKFCCEFIPDEASRTVDIKLFNEVVNMMPTQDITPYLASEPAITFPETYEQLIISSEDTISDEASVSPSDSIAILNSKYPSSVYDTVYGRFVRNGYSFKESDVGLAILVSIVSETVAEASMRYYAGGNLKTKEIKVPDTHLEFRPFSDRYTLNDTRSENFLFIGKANFLNSKLVLNKSSEDESTTENVQSENTEAKPMLAFFYIENNCPRGTITSKVRTFVDNAITSRTFSEYALCYNGPDGIFERFYRKYDDLLRNSLHKVKVKLLLSDALKQSLPAHQPILLLSQKLFINSLRYALGGDNEPLDTELFTTKLHEPVSSAPLSYVPDTGYEWIQKYSSRKVSQSYYNSSPDKDKMFDILFPPRPTADLAIPNKKYFEQTTCISYDNRILGMEYGEITFWLECNKKEA